MIVSYAKSLGLVIEFDADETKFGIKILEQILQLAKNLSEIGMEEDEEFVFNLSEVYRNIVDQEFQTVQ